MKIKNLYERNILACVQTHSKHNRLVGWIKYNYSKLFRIICFKYIEIPITTRCTLKCAECVNLIQFYKKPYHIPEEDIISDIRKLSNVSKEILWLRILGGEPLLHPGLANIIEQILPLTNIKTIQIVTNGTLLFDERMVNLLKNNKRLSVDISNYEEMSSKQGELIKQLEDNNIKYYTQKERIFWTAQADCSCRKRSKDEIKDILSKCSMDCISLLNGEIHLCPRSSHGMDLGIVPRNKRDYYNLRQMKSIKEGKKQLYNLLNTDSISACNYCDVYRWEELPEVKAAEQISKQDAELLLEKYLDTSKV